MKRKEMIQLGAAVVVLFVAGILVYTQLAPKKSSQSEEKYMVEKIKMIDADYDEQALTQITDGSNVRDFYTAPDLSTGLGNSQPFNEIR